MNCYKSLLLFSAAVLLLVGGRAYADEVSQSADQVPAVVTQADSQENQPPVINQEISPTETNQAEQPLPASEETSPVQDSAENQEPSPDSPDQTTNESQSQQVTAAEAATAAVTESESQEDRNNSDISTEEYEANVANLKKATMADVYHMFDDPDGSYALYIGRPTCHYCRDFSSVIKEFNGLTGLSQY